MAAKPTRLTHKTAIQLHPMAKSCTICSSCSRQPVWKLLDTPLYNLHCFCVNLFHLWHKWPLWKLSVDWYEVISIFNYSNSLSLDVCKVHYLKQMNTGWPPVIWLYTHTFAILQFFCRYVVQFNLMKENIIPALLYLKEYNNYNLNN